MANIVKRAELSEKNGSYDVALEYLEVLDTDVSCQLTIDGVRRIREKLDDNNCIYYRKPTLYIGFPSIDGKLVLKKSGVLFPEKELEFSLTDINSTTFYKAYCNLSLSISSSEYFAWLYIFCFLRERKIYRI